MNSKSIQPVELANTALSAPLAANRRMSGSADGASFASFLPVSVPARSGKADGHSLPVLGKNLPQQPAVADARQSSEFATTASETPSVPVTPASLMTSQVDMANASGQLPGSAENLPLLSPGRAQHAQTRLTNETESAAQELVPGPVLSSQPTPREIVALNSATASQSTADSNAIPANAATDMAAMRPLPVQTGNQPVQSSPSNDAGQPPAQVVVETPAMPVPEALLPVQLSGQAVQPEASIMTLAGEQLAQQPSSLNPAISESLTQASLALNVTGGPMPVTLPSNPANTPVTLQQSPAGPPPAAVNLPPETPASTQATNSQNPQDLIPANRSGQAAEDLAQSMTRHYPLDEGSRPPAREPLASVTHRAIQSVLAGQSGQGALQQSLQEQRDAAPGGNALASLTRTETQALSFLQTLSESGVASMASTKIQVPVGQQGWDKAVGQQLAMFVSRDINAATVRLNPQHLGQMEMQINLEGDKASVTFLSQHSVVREALESSLPRLREMLAESGLNLANVNISQQGSSHQNGRGMTGSQPGREWMHTESAVVDPEGMEEETLSRVALPGLIDAYA